MPKIHDYACPCGNKFEFMTMAAGETVHCPICDSDAVDVVLSGGTVFGTIVPDYPGAKKIKAGYVHTHADRPAEKSSVSVPRKVT